MGYGLRVTGCGRRETEDGRRETEDGRRETEVRSDLQLTKCLAPKAEPPVVVTCPAIAGDTGASNAGIPAVSPDWRNR